MPALCAADGQRALAHGVAINWSQQRCVESEWEEAEHVLQLLVLCSAGQIETNKFNESLLVEKLSQDCDC